MDFTIGTYKRLLITLRNQGFCFIPFSEYLSNQTEKVIVLRHDVDRMPLNSLEFAKILAEVGIRGTYYFRAIPESWDEAVIREIERMGHEIGYHYEDMNRCAVRGVRYAEEDLAKIAIESFAVNLEKLRKIVPVKTICMHGSPLSKWDSRLLWKYYDYRDFGIIGEPYFDIDFNKVCYITDTGRMWDGDSFNIRDKGTGNRQLAIGEEYLMPHAANLKPFPTFHTTFDIIRAAEEDRLPDKIMMTFHPQRWTDKSLPWAKELVWQNVKNVGKYFLVKWRDKGLGTSR